MSTAELEAVELAFEVPPSGLWRDAWSHLCRSPTAVGGFALVTALAVTEPDSVRLRSGNSVLIRAPHFTRLMEQQDGTDAGADFQGRTVYLSTAKGEPVALAEIAQGELRPFRVFNFGTAA